MHVETSPGSERGVYSKQPKRLTSVRTRIRRISFRAWMLLAALPVLLTGLWAQHPFREYIPMEGGDSAAALPPDYQNKAELVLGRLMYPSGGGFGRGRPRRRQLAERRHQLDGGLSARRPHLRRCHPAAHPHRRAQRGAARESRRRRRDLLLALPARGHAHELESHRRRRPPRSASTCCAAASWCATASSAPRNGRASSVGHDAASFPTARSWTCPRRTPSFTLRTT